MRNAGAGRGRRPFSFSRRNYTQEEVRVSCDGPRQVSRASQVGMTHRPRVFLLVEREEEGVDSAERYSTCQLSSLAERLLTYEGHLA